MKGLIRLRFLALAAFLAGTVPAGAAPAIRVIDEAGRPAAGVPVAPVWYLAEGKWIPYGGVSSGVDGRVALPEGTARAPGSLLALDLARNLGAVFPARPDGAGDVEARMAPITRLTLSFHRKEGEGDGPVGPVGVYVYPADGDAPLFKSRFERGTLPLPPGEYQLMVFGCQIETLEIPFRIPEDAASLSEGIAVVPSRLARLVGKELPAWSAAEARGVKAGAAPADFRGKWMLVAVWGFW